jgi:hypothetical protein
VSGRTILPSGEVNTSSADRQGRLLGGVQVAPYDGAEDLS